MNQSTSGDIDEEDEEEDESALVHGRRKRKVAFMPSVGSFFASFSVVGAIKLLPQIPPIQFITVVIG